MTTLWGNDNGGGGSGPNGHRVIVDYSYSQNIAGNYTDVSWSYGVDYGDPNYWNNIENRAITWSVGAHGSSVAGVSGYGAGTSSAGIINTSNPGYGGQIHYFWSGVVRIYHDSNGQAAIHILAQMSFNSNAYTSYIGPGDLAIPDIIQPPAAPGAPTVTRVNDGQIDLSWANNSSAHHEYASQSVQRSVDGGAFSTIASGLGAGATSYSDTATSANHKYAYKVAASNAAGGATSGGSADVFTTPAADTDLTATKLAGGDVQVTWTGHFGYSGDDIQRDIYDNPDDGGFAYLDTVSGSATSYTHVSPNPAQTHQYRTTIFPWGTTLYSNSDGSNTVVLLATAAAPTGLSPSGVARDAADVITLSWTHNPTDGTPQSARHVQYKVNAGAYADLVNDSSTSSSYDIAAGTLTNGDTITWKVATAGENGTLGPDSAEASFTLSAKPTATINTPGATYNTSSLTVTWGYFQAQSSAQAGWTAKLYDNANPTALLESITGTTETSGTFAHAVADGASYTVKLTVTSAAGLTSTEDSQAFTVTYLPPADIAIAGTFDNTAGFTVLTLTGQGAVTDVTEPITTVDVQRQIDGGAWVTILSGIVLDAVSLSATVQDTVPITVGTNTYRAIAYSAVPSSVMSSEIEVATSETTWGYLAGGDDFATVARFRAMPSFAPTSSRAKALYHFAGRPKPVQLAGEALTSTLSVSGKLTADSGTAADFEALGQAEGVVCWRGPDGRRVFASLDKVQIDVTRLHALPSVSFGLTEVDFAEGDQ